MSRFPRRNKLSLLTMAVAVAAVAAGAVGSTGRGATSAVQVSLGTTTLRTANYEQPTIQKVLQSLEKSFSAKHPNVKFNDLSLGANVGDYATRMKLAMAGPAAPDVVQIGQAQALMGPLVKAKLLRDLTGPAKQFGWASRFGPGLLDELKMRPDGKTFGSGSLYGVSLGGNMVGVYYNKAKLKALGFAGPPHTLAAFEQMLSKATASGQVALETGNLEKWPALHYFYALADVYCPIQQLRNWIYGDKGATIALPCATAALNRLASWGAKGYIPSSANGTAYADALTAFGKGTGVFMLTGSWAQAGFDQQAPGQIGFFLLPPLKAGQKPVATGALTPPYGISTKSKNPVAAAQWLDYLLTPNASNKLAHVGVLPALKTSTFKPPKGTALADVYAGWQSVLNANGLGLYFDWTTPKMLDVIDAPLQDIVAGKSDGISSLLQQMQQEWQSFHS